MNDAAPSRSSPVPLLRARDVGHTTRAVRAKAFVSVTRGVYAPAEAWARSAPWERYLARVHACALQHPDAVFCLESAAALRGLPVFGDPGMVHILRDDATAARTSGDVVTHVASARRPIHDAGGLLTTTHTDTAIDIARSRHPAIALAVADGALRSDPALTAETLVAENEARASSRGRRAARWALHRASPLPESALESVDRAVIEWLGFPDPELQVWIGNDRVDKWWPEYAIAGEGDGDLKYDGSLDDPRSAMRKRHERDARLFDNGVRAVPHWGWAEAVAGAPLRAILLSAGLPMIRTDDTARLFSLRGVLKSRHGAPESTPVTRIPLSAGFSSRQ